jgi:hypothetical protein
VAQLRKATHINHCKTQMKNIMILGTVTPAPADVGLNPDYEG